MKFKHKNTKIKNMKAVELESPQKLTLTMNLSTNENKDNNPANTLPQVVEDLFMSNTPNDIIAMKIICNSTDPEPLKSMMSLVLPLLTTPQQVKKALSFMTSQVINENMTCTKKWFVDAILPVRAKIGKDVWTKRLAPIFGHLLAVCGNTEHVRVPRWLYYLKEELGMTVDITKPIGQVFSYDDKSHGVEPSHASPYMVNFEKFGSVLYCHFVHEDTKWLAMLVRSSTESYWLPYSCIPVRYLFSCIYKKERNPLEVEQTERNVVNMFGTCAYGISFSLIESVASATPSGYDLLASNSSWNVEKLWLPIVNWEMEYTPNLLDVLLFQVNNNTLS